MKNRAAILLVALVIVVGGVLWLAIGLKGERANDDAIVSAIPATRPAGESSTVELGEDFARALEPTAATAERTRAEPRATTSDDPRVDPELRAAAWVEGRVELAPGTPSDEVAYVVAKGRSFESRPLYRAKVEPDGRFRVAFAQGTQLGWLLISARYNFLGDEFALRPAKPPQDIVLKGSLGGCVRGKINLAPTALMFLEDVKQGEVSIGEHEFDFFAIGRQPGRIDDDLTYEIGGIEAAAGLNVLLKARGLVPLRRPDVTIEAGRSTMIDLAPEMGIRISGRVVSSAGGALAEARVSPKRAGENDPQFWSMPTFALTSADGSFELVGIEDGAVSLLTQKQGFEPLATDLGPLSRGAEKKGLELVLGEGLALTGRVEFAAGKPAARALVSAIDENANDNVPEVLRMFDANALMAREPFETTSDGAFRITGLAPGTYTVTAEAWVDAANDKSVEDDPERARKVRRKGTPWSGRLERVTAGANDLVVTLKNGESIRGRIVDSSGKPVERFVVSASPATDSPGFTSEIKEIEKAFRDKDGRFVLDGLRACGWDIHVRSKGHLDGEPTKITVPGSNQDLRFTLLKQAKLTGVVFDPERKPLARAKIVCVSEVNSWFGGGASAHSNEKGEFTITQVPLGAIRVHAEANGFARGEPLRFELGPGAVKKDLQLFVTKGATIKGVVKKSDGTPDADRQVEAREVGGNWDKRVKTNADGEFLYEGLGPGRYELATTQPRPQRVRKLEAADEGDAESWRTTVAVRAGETVSVVLGGKPRLSIRMFGRITVKDGRAAKIVVTSLSHEDRWKTTEAKVGDDGRYEMHLTRSGAYDARIERDVPGFGAKFFVQVPAAAEFEKDFEMPACSVSGRVVTSADEPVANYRVRAYLPGTRDRRGDTTNTETRTDENGAFTIQSLPEGVVTVEATGPNEWWEESKVMGRARVDGVKLAADAPVVDLVLVLKSAGDITGYVRSAAGEVLPFVEVFAFDEHGHKLNDVEHEGTLSNSAGRFTIRGAHSGRVLLYARTLHSAGKALVTAHEDGPVEVDIALRPRADLTVLVQDSAGAPTYARLEIVDAEGRHFEEIEPLDTWLDAPTGARTFPSLPAGKYAIRALVESGGTAEKSALLTEGGRADVTLH